MTRCSHGLCVCCVSRSLYDGSRSRVSRHSRAAAHGTRRGRRVGSATAATQDLQGPPGRVKRTDCIFRPSRSHVHFLGHVTAASCARRPASRAGTFPAVAPPSSPLLSAPALFTVQPHCSILSFTAFCHILMSNSSVFHSQPLSGTARQHSVHAEPRVLCSSVCAPCVVDCVCVLCVVEACRLSVCRLRPSVCQPVRLAVSARSSPRVARTDTLPTHPTVDPTAHTQRTDRSDFYFPLPSSPSSPSSSPLDVVCGGGRRTRRAEASQRQQRGRTRARAHPPPYRQREDAFRRGAFQCRWKQRTQ